MSKEPAVSEAVSWLRYFRQAVMSTHVATAYVTRYRTIPRRDGWCGCLDVPMEDGHGVIFCNECGPVIEPLVPIEELDRALRELAMTDQVCSSRCPHCGLVETFPSFNVIRAYTCRGCGEGVSVAPTVQWSFTEPRFSAASASMVRCKNNRALSGDRKHK